MKNSIKNLVILSTLLVSISSFAVEGEVVCATLKNNKSIPVSPLAVKIAAKVSRAAKYCDSKTFKMIAKAVKKEIKYVAATKAQQDAFDAKQDAAAAKRIANKVKGL